MGEAGGRRFLHSQSRIDSGAVPPRLSEPCGEHSQWMMIVDVVKSKFRNSEIFLRFPSISFDFQIFLRFFKTFIIFFGRFPGKIKKYWQHCLRKLRRPPKRPQRNFETLSLNGRFPRTKTLQFRIFAEIEGKSKEILKIEGIFENQRKSKENRRKMSCFVRHPHGSQRETQ